MTRHNQRAPTSVEAIQHEDLSQIISLPFCCAVSLVYSHIAGDALEHRSVRFNFVPGMAVTFGDFFTRFLASALQKNERSAGVMPKGQAFESTKGFRDGLAR